MPRPTLLSLGSINADFQVRVDQPPGSTETLLAHDFRRFSGGKASNRVFLAARFGLGSRLLGRVGDDELAEQALAPLREAGVEVDDVGRAPGVSTAVSMIAVPPGGKKQIILAGNANDAWDEPAIVAMLRAIECCPGPAWLSVDYEVPAAVVRRAVETASGLGFGVVLDPSFPDRLEPDLLPRLLAIAPNATEAAPLVGFAVDGVDSAGRAARQLHEAGVGLACIKLGDGGCVLCDDAGLLHIPPDAVEPVDSTGAGDAFSGVLAIALAEGRPARQAAAWAVAAANVAVTGYGSQPAYPSRQQVESMAAGVLERACECD